MKLYTGPLSMFSDKVWIALVEKGIPFELEYVPFSIGALYEPKHPDVVRINPKRQVPVLTDGDLELFDSTQICEYLEDIAPSPPLWPSEPRARARARLFELKVDEVMFPNVIQLLSRSTHPLSEDATASAKRKLLGFYAEAEALLGEHEYLVGTFSYADIALFMASLFASFPGGQRPPAQLERLNAWQQRVAGRPSIQPALTATFQYLREQGISTVTA
jgi:glutathione S-transferase